MHLSASLISLQTCHRSCKGLGALPCGLRFLCSIIITFVYMVPGLGLLELPWLASSRHSDTGLCGIDVGVKILHSIKRVLMFEVQVVVRTDPRLSHPGSSDAGKIHASGQMLQTVDTSMLDILGLLLKRASLVKRSTHQGWKRSGCGLV